jgi:hypothetical protein
MKLLYMVIVPSTPLFIKKINGGMWKPFISTKETSFCMKQKICKSEIAFPVFGYSTFRFHNWLCAVEDILLTEKEI